MKSERFLPSRRAAWSMRSRCSGRARRLMAASRTSLSLGAYTMDIRIVWLRIAIVNTPDFKHFQAKRGRTGPTVSHGIIVRNQTVETGGGGRVNTPRQSFIFNALRP